MYVQPNYKTKKALGQAITAGESITVFQAGGVFPTDASDGEKYIEGPHYPEPHRWYARVRVQDGLVTKVLS
jgi:hypothetical protein